MNHSVSALDTTAENRTTMFNDSISSTTLQPPNDTALPRNRQLPPLQPRVDRFVPRANKNAVKSGGLAEACGVKVNRVLEFGQAPVKRTQSPANDLWAAYAPQPAALRRAEPRARKINTKPVKILDAPGLADEFYANVLDWSQSLDIMAIGLGSCVYGWDPKSLQVSVIADVGGSSSQSGSQSESHFGSLVSALRWTDDGCIAVASTTGEIQLWDAEQHTLLRSMRGRRGRVAALDWNEHILSSGGHDGSVWSHDVRVKQHKVAELRGHAGEVCGLSWRGDGRLLATGGNDNLVNVWDARTTSAPRAQLQQHEAAVKALAWCPWQASLLATGGGSADRTIKMWNAVSGACTETLDAGAQVSALHWSSRHNEIVASLGYPTNGITVWGQQPNLRFAKHAEIVNAHDSRILHSTLSKDGQTLVTGSADENLKFWNLFQNDRPPAASYQRSMLTMGRV